VPNVRVTNLRHGDALIKTLVSIGEGEGALKDSEISIDLGFTTKKRQSALSGSFTFQSHNTVLRMISMVLGLVNFKTTQRFRAAQRTVPSLAP